MYRSMTPVAAVRPSVSQSYTSPLGTASYTPGYPTGAYNSTSYTQGTSYASGGNYVSGGGGYGSAVKSERVLNSTVLKEEFLQGYPCEDSVKYVEVPVVEEVVRHVPKKEYVEVEKRVPKYEYEWVERIKEVPEIRYVDKFVEVPQIQEVLRHVPVKQFVDVPRETIKYVPKVENKIVEKEVEVPGEIIEVPRPYLVENHVVVPKFIDQDLTCVVAQSFRPVITESDSDFVEVEMREFNPYLVPVDVVVPRPVSRQLLAHKKTEEHRVVDIPVGHFNALLKNVNPNLSDSELEAKYISIDGVIPISVGVQYVALTPDGAATVSPPQFVHPAH